MNKRTSDPSMYSGTPCDLCEGPTLLLTGGSIWCPAEGPHRGGHFVKRMGFERTPAKQAAFEAANPIKSRVRGPKKVVADVNTAPAREGFGGGYDDFVDSDR